MVRLHGEFESMKPHLVMVSLPLLAAASCVSTHVAEIDVRPTSADLERHGSISVHRVGTDTWLEQNLQVARDPAFAHWRNELDASAHDIRDALRLRLRERYEVHDDAQGALELRLEVTEFNAGQRDPLGDGESRIGVRVVLVDSDTAEVLGSGRVHGTSARGVRDAARECVQGVLAMLQRPDAAPENPPATVGR